MINLSNTEAEDDKNFRSLQEQIVEGERVIYAIEEALKVDGTKLLSKNEISKIRESITDLKKSLDSTNPEEIKKYINKLENICETYVEKRMNSSIKSLITGKDINDIIAMPKLIFLPNQELCPKGLILEVSPGESICEIALENGINL